MQLISALYADASWYPLIQGMAIASEETTALPGGQINAALLVRLANAFTYTRQKGAHTQYGYRRGFADCNCIACVAVPQRADHQ